MIVLMPKFSYFTARNDSEVLAIRDIIKTTINEYIKDVPEVFIEDEFAINIFAEKELFTVTNSSNTKSIEVNNIFGDYTSRFLDLYKMSTCYRSVLPVSFYDPVMIMKNPKEYVAKWVEEYSKITLNNCTNIVKLKKVALVFIGNSGSKTKFTPVPEINDGILFIRASLETGSVDFYYSGMPIKKEIANKIIGGIYG